MKNNFVRFLIFLLFLTPSLYAQKKQGKSLVDSLLVELPKAKEDTDKVNMLKTISATFAYNSPQDGIIYGNQGLELAIKLRWKKGEGILNNCLGVVYLGKSDYSTALEYFIKALKICDNIGYQKGIANATTNIGLIYSNQGNFQQALQYYQRALETHKKIGNKAGVANVTSNIGSVYERQGIYPKALDFSLKASKMFEDIGDKNSFANVVSNLGNIYNYLGNYADALECYSEALSVFDELGNKAGIAGVKSSIGYLYVYQKNYTKALELNLEALKAYQEIGNIEGVASVSAYIGNIYAFLRNYPKCLEYYFKGLKLLEEIGDKQGLINVTGLIGITYCELKNEPLAVEFEQKALKMAVETNNLEAIKNCYKSLASIYDSCHEYKKAMDYLTKYHAIKDSIFSKDNGQKIVRLEMQNQNDRQHLADSLKTAEKEQLASIQLHRQRNYTYLGIAGIMLLLGFSFFIARERGKSEKERKKSDELLLNILPSEIAQELKVTGGSKARLFDNVTVLFTDFVNFTRAGERMTPQALVDELDTCFKAFDNITGKYNIEKIKTIGDAYLAVCGLPKADPAHAENVVKAAQEVKDFMANRYTQLGDKTFEIRIGVHSGNVVAGTVGVKKFAYDIWGDTVNTAARMEQNSEAGKINISETTYALVKDKFTCTYRGEIEAKNKGMLKMYFVA